MPILGLTHTETDSNWRFKNVRRSVFHQYPNGAFPLTAILSLISDEATNDPEFQIYEKRYVERKTTTVAGWATNTNGPFSSDGTNGETTAGFNKAIDSTLYIKVASTALFRQGNTIEIEAVPNGPATDKHHIRAIVTERVSATVLKTRLLQAYTSISNDSDAVGLTLRVVSNAAEEGQVGAQQPSWELPINISNYTQIFRTPFQFTGTALKTGLKFDVTGPYKERAKEASIDHMVEIEHALINGVRSAYADPTTGLMTRTTGGIIWFLEQYEAQYSRYRGGDGVSTGPAAATLDSDDDKRIINNAGGTIDLKTYNGYLERVFRKSSNVTNEKLVVCGSGFLNVVNDMYFGRATLQTGLPMKDTFGMDVVKHVTPQGTVYYKTHPLFNQNSVWRYRALFVDVHLLKYRYMQGRDTELLKWRQPNNADYREDEWFTEAGLELRFPEAFMLLKNVTDYVP